MTDWKPVLTFWFGEQSPPDKARQKRWFQSSDATDQAIAAQFKDTHTRVSQGYPEDWPDAPRARLAAILVIDQFSRNLYRGQAQAFAWDPMAVEWSVQGLDQGQFVALTPAEQGFAVLPLVHAESLPLHDKALTFLRSVQQQNEPDGILTGFLSSAREHRDIIARFGRYPHRNAVLNRPSTPEETDYLANGAKRFGQ